MFLRDEGGEELGVFFLGVLRLSFVVSHDFRLLDTRRFGLIRETRSHFIFLSPDEE